MTALTWQASTVFDLRSCLTGRRGLLTRPSLLFCAHGALQLHRIFFMRTKFLVVAGAVLFTSAAFAAEPMVPSDIQAIFFKGQPFTASTTSGIQFKITFTPDGQMTRQPRGKSGKRARALGNLTAQGFAGLVVSSGKNKCSIQKGFTTIAVWGLNSGVGA